MLELKMNEMQFPICKPLKKYFQQSFDMIYLQMKFQINY